MNEKNKLEQLCDEAPSWVISILPLISAVAGVVVLWATWHFYKDIYTLPRFQWYNWLQPALMVIAGFMCLTASALFILRKPVGWDLLWTAMGIIPIILALRLVIVILRLIAYVGHWMIDNAGRMSYGTFFDQISINPRSITVSVVILIVVIASHLFAEQNKSGKTPKEKR